MNTNDPDRSLTPSEKQRLHDLATTNLKADLKKETNPNANNEFNLLVLKVNKLQDAIRYLVKPIIAAGGAVPTPENKLSMEVFLHGSFVEAFNKNLSKDELVQMLSWVYTATAMQGIFTDKLGKGPSI